MNMPSTRQALFASAAVLLVACSTPDATTPDAADMRADADLSVIDMTGGEDMSDAQDMPDAQDMSAPTLGALVDEEVASVFAPTPARPGQCVGGVVVVVSPAGRIVRGYGATALGGAVRPDAQTIFQVGSVSKVFTGLGVAGLVAEGGIGPDTPASELIKGPLRDARAVWPTIGALISHHAGLPDFPDNLVDRDGDGLRDAEIDTRSPAEGYSRAHLAAFLQGWTPGVDTYAYSNVGLGLAGIALQDQVGAMSYHAALRTRVAQPLQLADTLGSAQALSAAQQARVAQGHIATGQGWTQGRIASMGVLAGSGEVLTTGADMERVLLAMTGAAPGPLDAAVQTLITPLGSGPNGGQMGYGIEIEPGDAGAIYRKSGVTSSYTAHVVFSRSRPVGVALLTSCGGFMPAKTTAERLFTRLLALP